MPELREPTSVDAIVSHVVGEAADRLTSAASDAQERHATLTKARKEAGNRRRSADIRAAIEAEEALIADARALAKRTTQLRQTMTDDLERLVALSLGRE
jgi:hypothetical protein